MSDIVTRLWGNTGKYPGFENLNTEAAAAERVMTVRAGRHPGAGFRSTHERHTSD